MLFKFDWVKWMLPTEKRKWFSLATLGVVYGDIGTSPLYAFKESLHGIPVTTLNILGVLSLIFWSLLFIISIKYLVIILRADNDGEGGILSLFALLKRGKKRPSALFLLIGILGAGLLLSDGMLTPAISVISAVEGLNVIFPAFTQYVLPITIGILIALFIVQHLGTEKIGHFFGPILLCWFVTIGLLGLYSIIANPAVIAALNPYYAIEFFIQNGWIGYILLGGIFLAVTGGEALYADLGHFGKSSIRGGWFMVVLPALVLNYFGQGAYLLTHHEAILNPFYALAPSRLAFSLLILATGATIIASQAVITAAFSMVRQAVLLDLYPRLPIIQTSSKKMGQIYVPQMNTILAIGTLALVITFKSSSTLAHAYGIAVNLDMLLVTLMVMSVAYKYWQWSFVKILAVFSLFLFFDAAFLGANSQKIATGGWVPLLFAAFCGIVMWTWQQGLAYLRATFMEKIDLNKIVKELTNWKLNYLPHVTSVFVVDPYDKSGGSLLHYLKLNRILPEHVLIVSIKVTSHPYIKIEKRYEFTVLGEGVYQLVLHYGFMQLIDIPLALGTAAKHNVFPFKIDIDQLTYLIEIIHVSPTRRLRTIYFFWQEKLFAFLMRNSALDIEFYKLPYNRTIAIGTYCEI